VLERDKLSAERGSNARGASRLVLTQDGEAPDVFIHFGNWRRGSHWGCGSGWGGGTLLAGAMLAGCVLLADCRAGVMWCRTRYVAELEVVGNLGFVAFAQFSQSRHFDMQVRCGDSPRLPVSEALLRGLRRCGGGLLISWVRGAT